ncbi:acetyl-CoA sensor PanZ family protein [Paraferrimonas sp. SM1919]|uniref:acetyl-CoA sensor PanZ family protein n=1 Tax=Paraferrimonas sp. SM1919 TaxID=2662263 RepID=UPI0013D1B9AE|nr:acetyl-CoA sensor PanZ family protein [Paraferrimonas sp. SM1919]
MRLMVKPISEIDARLEADLAKICADIPEWLAPQLAAVTDGYLFTSTFNDRHIASCHVNLEQRSLIIEHLIVGEINRNRGIGHDLLRQVIKHFKTPTQLTFNNDLKVPSTFRKVLVSCGYEPQVDGSWMLSS